MTHKQLATAGLTHFAPTMTYFAGASPDFRARLNRNVTQRELVNEFAWGRSPTAAAIGILALVEVARDDVAGALICSSVAQGSTILLPGYTTVDPDQRANYFDLDPLRHRPRFQRGWAWLVGTTLSPTATDPRWPAVVHRYTGGTSNGSATPSQHCHLVLVDDAPPSWTHRYTTETRWELLSSDARASIGRAAPSAFPIHSDPETRFYPRLACTWAFDPGEIQVAHDC